MSNYSASQFKEDDNTPWFKVLRLVRPNSIVLDIGCSSGNFGAELASRKQCEVDGVEVDSEDAALAKKKLRKVYMFNIEHEVPKKLEGRYDYVYFGDVIEHLVDPVKALGNAKKLLREGGSVIFSVPNMAHMSVRLMLLNGDFTYGKTGLLDNTHLHFYTRRSIEEVFANAGYRLEQMDWVRRDVPNEILDERLQALGLRAEEKFRKMNKGIEAAGYQFIGEAKPATKHARFSRPEVSPPINEMENHLSRLHKEHQEEVGRIEKHYENLIEEKKRFYEQKIKVRDERIATSVQVPAFAKKVGKKILRRKD